MTRVAPLTWAVQEEGVVVASLSGELDIESCADVRSQLVELLDTGVHLVLDLQALEFLDSSGLGALIGVLMKAHEVHASVVVTNVAPAVRRVLDTSKVAELFGLSVGVAPRVDATGRYAGANDVSDPREPAPDRAIADARALLSGFENLLRWGDLRPEQVTLALAGTGLADGTTDLVLAARVRDVLLRL